MELVGERISDRRVFKLMRQWLKAGVMEDGTVRETLAGTPQGGVISPLLANIYLHTSGSDLGRRSVAPRDAGAVRRRFRGDVQNGGEGEGGASTNRVCDEQAGFDAASGEDADGESPAREGKLRVSWDVRCARSGVSCGTRGHLHAPVAVAEGEEAAPGPRAGDDRSAGSGKDVKQIIARTESCDPRLGQLLPDRQLPAGVSPDGLFRVSAAASVASSPRRATHAAVGLWTPRTVPWDGSVSTASDRALPCASRAIKITGKPCAGKPHARFERGLMETGQPSG